MLAPSGSTLADVEQRSLALGLSARRSSVARRRTTISWRRYATVSHPVVILLIAVLYGASNGLLAVFTNALITAATSAETEQPLSVSPARSAALETSSLLPL